MGSVLSWNKPAELPARPSLVNDGGALPTDLPYEVLLRVPARELCRLRLVCRSWRSLTSNPGFAEAHACRHPLVVCIHNNESRKARNLEVRIVDLSGNIIKRVPLQNYSYELSTQLGLVCVKPASGRDPCSVFNLTTREAAATAIILPDTKCGQDRSGPSILGHVPSTGDYKVLRTHTYVMCDDEGDDYLEQTCHVMTLGGDVRSGGWRTRPSPPVLVAPQSGQVVVVNGVAYFLLSQYYIDNNPTKVKPDTVALFDMATEEWRQETLRGPVNSHAVAVDKTLMYNNLELAVLDSCLVMVQHGFRKCSIDLWFLEDMGKGLWSKRYSAQYPPSGSHKYNSFYPPYPLVILEDGKIVMWVAGKQVLRVYDSRGRTLEHSSAVSMYTGNLL